MWRYLKNVSNPKEEAAKRTRERDREYEDTKRKRTYRKEWERDYPWLEYDDAGEGVMFCKTCKNNYTDMTVGKNPVKNTFIQGCTNLEEHIKY